MYVCVGGGGGEGGGQKLYNTKVINSISKENEAKFFAGHSCLVSR